MLPLYSHHRELPHRCYPSKVQWGLCTALKVRCIPIKINPNVYLVYGFGLSSVQLYSRRPILHHRGDVELQDITLAPQQSPQVRGSPAQVAVHKLFDVRPSLGAKRDLGKVRVDGLAHDGVDRFRPHGQRAPVWWVRVAFIACLLHTSAGRHTTHLCSTRTGVFWFTTSSFTVFSRAMSSGAIGLENHTTALYVARVSYFLSVTVKNKDHVEPSDSRAILRVFRRSIISEPTSFFFVKEIGTDNTHAQHTCMSFAFPPPPLAYGPPPTCM